MEVGDSEKAAAEPKPLEPGDQKSGPEEEGEEPEEQEEAGDKKRVVPGIVYLGHLPPRFRPLHVRNLLSAYGEVGRVFFQPEDGFVRRKKKKAAAAGEKKSCKYSKDYTEGWVEFRDKRVAKRVAASLHNTPMGARRRSPFRYDLWNLKEKCRRICCDVERSLQGSVMGNTQVYEWFSPFKNGEMPLMTNKPHSGNEGFFICANEEAMKGQRFDDIEEAKTKMREVLSALQTNEFEKCF